LIVTVVIFVTFTILDSRGQFTYWSQRSNGRPYNKGLRLDYFVCSDDMFPIGVEVEIEVRNGMKNEDNKLKGTVASDEHENSSSSSSTITSASTTKVNKKRKATSVDTVSSVEVVTTQTEDNIQIVRIIPSISTTSVIDSYTLHAVNDCSDHCPVVLLLSHNR
jgi:hypothetical protein